MLEWLKKLGGGKPWQNKAGLDAKAISFLEADFKDLEKLNANLTAELVRYLLDGDDDSVLGRLAGTTGAGEALGLIRLFGNVNRTNADARARLFQHVNNVPPDFFIRLGKTYEAATRAPYTNPAYRAFQSTAANPNPTFGDNRLQWLHFLLVTATSFSTNTWPRKASPCPALNADMVEAIIELEGFPRNLLVRTAFAPPQARYGGGPLEEIFFAMPGIAARAIQYKEILVEALNNADFKHRVYTLEMMKKCHVPLEPLAGKLVDLAVSSSKLVREQAEVMIAEAKPVFTPLLKEKIVSGETDERIAAARLLWRWEEEAARGFLEQRLTEEKSKKVAQAFRDLLAVPAKDAAPVIQDALQLPELPPIPAHLPLGAETERAWQACMDQVNQEVARMTAGKPNHYYAKNMKPVSAATIRQAFAELAGGKIATTLESINMALGYNETAAPLKTFWQRPELQPIHLVRFMMQTGTLRPDAEADVRHHTFGYWLENLITTYRKAHPDFGLREFAAAFRAAGLDSARIGKGFLIRFGTSRGYGMTREQTWPYWAEHLEVLENAFAPASSDLMTRIYQRGSRDRAFSAIASFPQTPARLQPMLWNLALGPKSERPQAQECLANVPDKLERLIAALGSGSGETRLAAAEWLGNLGEKSAVEPLIAAFKREKNEATKGMILGALEQLGASVEQFLNRAGQSKEAEKGLAKGVPADLSWFPFDQMPAVHWQDTGEKLDPNIIKWWLVQGFKLKSPEPGALLRRYCASLKPAEREALGQFILQAWIAEDTAPIPRAEAEKKAQDHAKSMVHYAQYFYQQAQKNPQGVSTAAPPLSEDQYYAQALPNFLKQPKGSAVSSKGVLAVAGACVASGAAPVVNRYLKEWYGQRAAQCRAMLQMLSWVEHRTATQLLLAVGSRFRTKSIQEEAHAQAQALAERKGWTVAELADRTIPSAGLDENGVMTIDYGPRKFTATLDENLEFVLADAEGKPLKALPDPRKDDDEALATEAKKMYSAAKKELKSVLNMQRERLYEAMCTQRTWPYEDWSLYLNRHPIVRHHCQRLVWAIIRDNKAVQLFRPLADGSLTNASDDPVIPAEGDQVRVAHECQITPEQSQAWRQHLKDYNVEVLFEQFGRTNFTLSEANRNEADINEFKGHLLETFKLRGRATKLGYTRGQAQDGGWFFDYHKRFPTLGIEAVIEFTGNGLPEENRTVALTLLHFDRVGEEGSDEGSEKMLLSEVPSVLLSECWNDMRAIAAEGPGFDPAWEKKAQF